MAAWTTVSAHAGVSITVGLGSVSYPYSYTAVVLTGLSNSGLTAGQASKSDYLTGTSYGRRSASWGPGLILRFVEPLDTGDATFVTATNNAGKFVGRLTSGSIGTFASWPSRTALDHIMGTPSGSNSGAGGAALYDLNEAGQSAGYYQAYDSNFVSKGTRPVRGNANDTLSVLDLPAGFVDLTGKVSSGALAINENGVIAGNGILYSGTTELGNRALRWSPSGVPAVLDTINTQPNGNGSAVARGLNSSGVLAGYSTRYSGSNDSGARAVRWNTGGTAVTELANLGTDINGATYSAAEAINDAGVIAGRSAKFNAAGADLGSRAVRWSPTGTITELGNLGTNAAGVTLSRSNAINAGGAIIGLANRNGVEADQTPTLWLANSTMAIDLNTLLPTPATTTTPSWTLLTAERISDTGFIAGLGFYRGNGTAGTDVSLTLYTLLVPQAGTYGKGDANFDTKTNFADLVILAQHYSQSNAAQNTNVGDFDLNGVTDFTDLVVLAQNYGSGGASLAGTAGDAGFAADWALAQSLVPEPASLAAGMTVLMLTSRFTSRRALRANGVERGVGE